MAHLEGAVFTGTHLDHANLIGAHFDRAILVRAHLEGAVLDRAHFEGAFLLGAHLEGARGLDRSFGDAKTHLPERPAPEALAALRAGPRARLGRRYGDARKH
jgi:hypothetical protein